MSTLSSPVPTSASYHVMVAGASHPGKIRSNNEDAWRAQLLTAAKNFAPERSSPTWTDAHPGILLVVCDGLGGGNAGEVASRVAAESIASRLAAGEFSLSSLLAAMRETNELVAAAARSRPELHGMGTTLSCAWLASGTCLWGQVGDSRLYLLRATRLQQLTPEHSLVGRLRRAGEITEQEARDHPLKSQIDQCLGSGAHEFHPDAGELTLTKGDVLLACSDGLTDGLTDEEIRAHLEQIDGVNDPARAASTMVHAAVKKSGRDNTTAVVARILDTRSPARSPGMFASLRKLLRF